MTPKTRARLPELSDNTAMLYQFAVLRGWLDPEYGPDVPPELSLDASTYTESITALGRSYSQARTQRDHTTAVETIADMMSVRAVISDTVGTAAHEVLACQPGGGRPEAALRDALPRDLAMLSRGVWLPGRPRPARCPPSSSRPSRYCSRTA